MVGTRIFLKATATARTVIQTGIRYVEKKITLQTFPNAMSCSPRNSYQNYTRTVNLIKKIVYIYMKTLKPRAKNAYLQYVGFAKSLVQRPLLSKTIELETRIFPGVCGRLCNLAQNSAQTFRQTHSRRGLTSAGTLWVMGDLKK